MIWHGICFKIPFLLTQVGSPIHACPLAHSRHLRELNSHLHYHNSSPNLASIQQLQFVTYYNVVTFKHKHVYSNSNNIAI